MPNVRDCLTKAAELVTGGNFGEAGKLIKEADKLNTQIISMAIGGSGRRGRPPAPTDEEQQGIGAATAVDVHQVNTADQLYSILPSFPEGFTRQDMFAEMKRRGVLPTWREGTLQTQLNRWAGAGVIRLADNGKYMITGKQPEPARAPRQRAA